MTVNDILRLEPQSIHIIKKYNLDAGGTKTLLFEDACRKHAVDARYVKNELIELRLSLKQANESFAQLLDGILQQHEVIKNTLSNIKHALHLAIQHQTDLQEKLLTVKNKFDVLSETLDIHLYKEEMILFPEFVKLWNNQKNQGERLPLFRMMYPIEGLEDEHQLARTILIDMRSIIRYGKIPKGVGVYYEYVCQELESFEKQMINLMDQENQLLFPKALELEQTLTHS